MPPQTPVGLRTIAPPRARARYHHHHQKEKGDGSRVKVYFVLLCATQCYSALLVVAECYFALLRHWALQVEADNATCPRLAWLSGCKFATNRTCRDLLECIAFRPPRTM